MFQEPKLSHLWYFCLLMGIISSYLPRPWWSAIWLALALVAGVVEIEERYRSDDDDLTS